MVPLLASAGEGLIMDYHILSDEFNNAVPEGKCLVYGQVLDQNQHGMSNALVSTFDFGNQAITDTSGTFKIWLTAEDSAIFCFVSGYNEVLVYHDFKSQHAVNLIFLPQQNQKIQVAAKPVIYAYSPEPLTATIYLNIRGYSPFFYPAYENEWQFNVGENSQLINERDGKTYPYLFWEAQSADLAYVTDKNELDGFLIKSDTCISFMENTLITFGFNSKEKVDFITYWGPKMIVKDYCLIQFISGEKYESEIAGINVKPLPQSMLRLFMFITPLDEAITPYQIKPPKIEKFNRTGFTILEWGGSILPLVNDDYLPNL